MPQFHHRRCSFVRNAVLFAGIAWGAMLPAQAAGWRQGECGRFTVAVIPDTQNYTDFTHQKAEGFPLDAAPMFFEQMRYIADNARSQGGDIVFATHMGDVWQHYSQWMDPGHEQRGFKWMPNAAGSAVARQPYPQVRSFEIPTAIKAFELLAGKLPFSVVPGNHDYDALWTDPQHAPQPGAEDKGVSIRHIGGLTGYLSAFSNQSPLFKGQPWYVASNDEGADSAQVFNAGKCQLLHIGLQFDPPDSSLAWARRVIKRFPGIPTLVTVHKYLDRDGRRADTPALDLSVLDRRDNNPQMVWDEFISQHDQVFMVLSGHIGGQGYSVDHNDDGHEVHQMLADYQGRSRVARQAAGSQDKGLSTGDGWLRLLDFDLDSARPTVKVRTYSTHYRKHSTEFAGYADAYKKAEGQQALSDEAFATRDAFTIELGDFAHRFGHAAGTDADRR